MYVANIVIYSKHDLFRETLIKSLKKEGQLNITGNSGSEDDLKSLIPKVQFDIVFIGYDMQENNAFEIIREIRNLYPYKKIILISFLNSPILNEAAITAGADFIISTTSNISEYKHVIAKALIQKKHISKGSHDNSSTIDFYKYASVR
jgi:DNA-binding NarL/FixJ family response regulator